MVISKVILPFTRRKYNCFAMLQLRCSYKLQPHSSKVLDFDRDFMYDIGVDFGMESGLYRGGDGMATRKKVVL